jgi:hypothetical protein
MATMIMAVALAPAGLAGSAGAAQNQAPDPINIDSQQAVNACLTPAQQRLPVARMSAAQRQRILACVNAAAARQANAQLPVQIDSVTRLDRITTAGSLLTYHYTIARRAAELPAGVREAVERETRANVCRQANMVSTIRMGGVYGYRWVDPDGVLIHEMQVSSC